MNRPLKDPANIVAHSGKAQEPLRELNLDISLEPQGDVFPVNPDDLMPAGSGREYTPPAEDSLSGDLTNRPVDPQPQSPREAPDAEFSPPQAPPTEPQVRETPAPREPQTAAELAEARANYGRTIQELGQKQDRIDALEREVTKMQLLLEAATAQTDNPEAQIDALSLPEGVDPDQAATLKDLWQTAREISKNSLRTNAQQQAEIIRAKWNVTPEIEADILEQFPAVNNFLEPQKTQKISELAARFYSAPTSGSTADQNASSSPSSPNRETPSNPAARPLRNVVPAPESQAMTPPEPRSVDELELAHQEYAAARQEKDPRAREQKMLAAAEKISQLTSGRSFEELNQGSFVSS